MQGDWGLIDVTPPCSLPSRPIPSRKHSVLPESLYTAVNEELVILGYRGAAPQAFHTLEDKAKAWQGLLGENLGRGQMMTGTVMKGHGDR